MIHPAARLFFLSVTSTILFSCEEKAIMLSDTVPFEKETYEVVDFCLSLRESKDKNENLRNKLTNEAYYETDYIVSAIEKAFPEDELLQIRKQLKDTVSFRLRPEMLKEKVNVIPAETIQKMLREAEKAGKGRLFWQLYHQKYGDKTLISISKPVFSKNGTMAVVSLSYSHGSLSGFGYTLLLEKTGDEWRIIRQLSIYIS